MSKTLIERIRAARQTRVSSHGKTFVVRRPTPLEMLEMRGRGVQQSEVITRFVTGWEGFSEMDLVSGGGPDPAPFDPALFAEHIADHPEYWDDIVKAVLDGYQSHEAALEERLKNLAPGSTD